MLSVIPLFRTDDFGLLFQLAASNYHHDHVSKLEEGGEVMKTKEKQEKNPITHQKANSTPFQPRRPHRYGPQKDRYVWSIPTVISYTASPSARLEAHAAMITKEAS